MHDFYHRGGHDSINFAGKGNSPSEISLPVISKLLRHKNLQTTEPYLQAIDPRFRDTMRLLEGNVIGRLSEKEIAEG